MPRTRNEGNSNACAAASPSDESECDPEVPVKEQAFLVQIISTAGIARLAEANREAPEEPHKETQEQNAGWTGNQRVNCPTFAR